MVAIEYLHIPFFKTIHQSLESGSIPVSAFPVNELACFSGYGLPDPKFVFLYVKSATFRPIQL